MADEERDYSSTLEPLSCADAGDPEEIRKCVDVHLVLGCECSNKGRCVLPAEDLRHHTFPGLTKLLLLAASFIR